MSDYSTSTTPNETQYQENTPTITPEIVDAEVLDDIDDADLVETNPVAALAGNFQDDERTAHPLAPGETNYTEQEARQATEDIKVKILHAAEAQYDLVHAVEKAFDGHIWVALGYPEGMKGWIQYCADNFAAEKIRVTGQQRTDLITGFTPGKITISCINGVARVIAIAKRHFVNGSRWAIRNPVNHQAIVTKGVTDNAPSFTHPDAVADGAERAWVPEVASMLCIFAPRPFATVFALTNFSEPSLFPFDRPPGLRLPTVEDGAHHLPVKNHSAFFHDSTPYLLFMRPITLTNFTRLTPIGRTFS